ncbi:MAG TPA: hypothetical protein VFM18_08730 [Methanosarcina sp.]|nr:hypothetical protein [Methanosarcina sp.]
MDNLDIYQSSQAKLKQSSFKAVLQSFCRPKERSSKKELLAPEKEPSEATVPEKKIAYHDPFLRLPFNENIRYGAKRRAWILEQLKGREIPVNLAHTADTKDPDLRYLLKKGYLVRIRSGGDSRPWMGKRSYKRTTYLVLNPDRKP